MAVDARGLNNLCPPSGPFVRPASCPLGHLAPLLSLSPPRTGHKLPCPSGRPRSLWSGCHHRRHRRLGEIALTHRHKLKVPSCGRCAARLMLIVKNKGSHKDGMIGRVGPVRRHGHDEEGGRTSNFGAQRSLPASSASKKHFQFQGKTTHPDGRMCVTLLKHHGDAALWRWRRPGADGHARGPFSTKTHCGDFDLHSPRACAWRTTSVLSPKFYGSQRKSVHSSTNVCWMRSGGDSTRLAPQRVAQESRLNGRLGDHPRWLRSALAHPHCFRNQRDIIQCDTTWFCSIRRAFTTSGKQISSGAR